MKMMVLNKMVQVYKNWFPYIKESCCLAALFHFYEYKAEVKIGILG